MLSWFAIDAASAQRTIRIVEQQKVSGQVRSVGPGRIEIADESGTVRLCRIQSPSENGLALQGAVLRFPAKIEVRGKRHPDELTAGMLVQFEAKLSPSGKVREPVARFKWLDQLKPAVELLKPAARRGAPATYRIVGAVVQVRANKLTVAIPKNDSVRKSKLFVTLADDAVVEVELSDLQRVPAGSRIVQAALVRFDTGDWAVRELRVELEPSGEKRASNRKAKRGRTGGTSVVRGEDRYGYLSDEPQVPRDVRSSHFVLHTDVSDRQARIMLDRLETMYGLLAGYFGKRPQGPIECYVVRDLSQWQGRLPAAGVAKIAEGAGVTASSRLGNLTRAIVYACDKPGVVQHEAVHAYCNQAFGSAGPTWYAEGIAEVGNYWKKGQAEVDVPAVVITYLRSGERKSLGEIVAPGQITGDSWQAYAWRWALCHLLMNNPNYAPRFRSLGIKLMQREQGVSFESAYGSMAAQLSFEYDWFTKHVDNGFRADLCAWDWKTRFRSASSKPRKITVQARRGWQPSGIKVQSDVEYRFESLGEWKIDAAEAVDADGRDDGAGRLEGVILTEEGTLTDAFPLGASGMLRPPATGRLYLRCRDDWTRIGDNSGSVRVEISRS